MSDVVYLTQEGYQKVQEELTHRREVLRVEISDKLQKAIAEGDLKENANYHDAKEKQAFNEGRIRDLEDTIRRAQIIDENVKAGGGIRVGNTVTIAEVGFEDEEEVYRIVGGHEADPSDGLISNESPIGSALLGKKKGQTVTVMTPRGEMQFKILKVE